VKVILVNKQYFGMLNVGKKPTLNEGKHSVEVHIFDFSADVYDSEIKVEFLKRIRDEKLFDSLADLQSQLKIDENNCRKFLAIINENNNVS
jgi:riboflavin kinase/FMN adenylyltransferase